MSHRREIRLEAEAGLPWTYQRCVTDAEDSSVRSKSYPQRGRLPLHPLSKKSKQKPQIRGKSWQNRREGLAVSIDCTLRMNDLYRFSSPLSC
jgi:hypothetical protein